MKHRSRLLICSIIAIAFSQVAAALAWQNAPELELSKPIEKDIAAEEVHHYSLKLAAGQFAHLAFSGKGVSMGVKVFTPGDKQLAEVGKLNNSFGIFPLAMIAEADGDYRVEIRSVDKKPGRYTLTLDEQRQATEDDRHRFAAEAAFLEAELLRQRARKEDYLSAIEKLKEALPHWRAIGNRRAEADTLLAIGEVLDDLDENRKAIEQYQLALGLYRADGEQRGEADALGNIGSSYDVLGEAETAIAHHQQALAVRRAIGDKSGEATSLYDIGVVYDRTGDESKALEYGLPALALWQQIKDPVGEARTLNLLGVIYDSMGDKQTALKYFQLSLPLRRQTGDVRGEAFTLANLGDLSNWLGEQQQALDYFTQALALFKQLGRKRGEALMLNNLGKFYALLGDADQAIGYFEQTRDLSHQIGDPDKESDALNNLGWVHSGLGDWRQAIRFYDSALVLERQIKDRNGEGYTLSNLGLAYLQLGEQKKALDHIQSVLALSRELQSRPLEALALKNLGQLYETQGLPQQSRDALQQSLALAREVNDARLEIAVLGQLARLDQTQDQLEAALRQIQSALDRAESLRVKAPAGALRTTYFSTIRDHYEFYIDLLMQLHKRQPKAGYAAMAFQTSERERARTLLESLGSARSDIRQGVDPLLLKRETALRQQLNYKEQALTGLLSGKQNDKQAAEQAAAKKELESLLTQYQEVEMVIRARSPRYAALTQPEPLSLAEIQKQVLDQNTLLLEYALGEELSYLFAVTRDSFNVYELPKRADIEALAKEFYQITARRSPQFTVQQEWLAQSEKRLPASAAKLSRVLLSPVAARLDKKRLLIVAEGWLQYIPFAALPVVGGRWPVVGKNIRQNRPPTTNHQPLILNHEIISLPSASVLAALRRELQQRPLAQKSLAVLADPVFAKDDARLKPGEGTASSSSIGRCAPFATKAEALRQQLRSRANPANTANKDAAPLARLCFTRDEANAIAALAPDQAKLLALDFNASREQAISSELGQYRIIHFATHGWLDAATPDLSAVVLSLVDKNGQPQNGFLRLHEIYNLNLPAELVVLSACETGVGKDVKGEGLINLTRGFMYAGARRVAVTLWPVNDPATAELMKRFYRGMLKENLRPAAALRQAQSEMLKTRWHSPYYWAGFVLQGEW